MFGATRSHCLGMLAVVTFVRLALASPAAATAISDENAKAGTTAWRLTDPAVGGEIEGYASSTSVDRGGDVAIFIRTSAPAYAVEIYRMGWYGGLG
ncbi:MAG TPA: hypothetical protein VFA38_04180, partial [Nitrospirales bacterium]|nr:hypothetical protein [Nitrospirales bacterium]